MKDEKIEHIVFLDIDGVMTSVENGTSFLCENVAAYHLDEQCLGNLLRLKYKFPDLKVVISSAWVNRCTDIDDESPIWPWKNLDMRTPLPALHRFLVEHDMFLDAVDNRSKLNCGHHVSKYEKIRTWILANKFHLSRDVRILVLDDDNSEYNELLKLNELERWDLLNIHFQRIDYKHGFNDFELEYAIKWFEK